MVRTPSLRTRVVVVGLVFVAVLAVCFDVLLYLAVRSSRLDDLDLLLDTHAAAIEAEAQVISPERLPARLAALEIPATVRRPNGTVAGGLLSLEDAERGGVITRTVELPGGWTAQIAASKADMERTLDRLLRTELIATPLVLLLFFLLLRLVADVALRPLTAVADAVRRTIDGQRRERLKPARHDTDLGVVGKAYDEMLDALDSAVGDARDAEARYRQVLETAREAFIAMDGHGRVIEWNPEAERAFGWSRDEVLGRPALDVVVPPDAREIYDAQLQRFVAADDRPTLAQRRELSALHRDGHTFPVEMTVWSNRHAGALEFYAFVRDATERDRAQRAIARLAAVVESSDEAMLSVGLDGVIVTWNGGAERMYGYAASEVVGQHLGLVVPPARRPEVSEALALVSRDEAVPRIDTVHRRKDGTTIDVALSFSPVKDSAGAVCGASAVARDTSQEHRMAEELDQTLLALEAALAEARASEAGTRRFLDDAAHQLRAPITSIRACVEALLRTDDRRTRERFLGQMMRETSRASRLMSGLLRMARLNQGQPLNPQPCDVVELCQEEVERARAMAPSLDVVVVDDGTAALRQAHLDRESVGEIVANLLDNARRHAASRITVHAGARDGQLEITVVDDGAGVPPDASDEIFDRFVSLDGAGGSGLGLSIARELARAQGGDLSYEGGRVILRLPAVAAPDRLSGRRHRAEVTAS